MPLEAIPGFPGDPTWRAAKPEAGQPAMIHSLRQCLDWTQSAAADLTATAETIKQLLDQPNPPLYPPPGLAETIAGLDTALNRTISQWRELARTRIICYAAMDHYHCHHSTYDGEPCQHPTLNEAVNAELEAWPDFDYPETMNIGHYVHRPVSESPLVHLLEALIEDLDEEHGGDRENGGIEKPSEELKAAERRLIESTLLEYQAWYVETTAVTEVNVRQWLAVHRPDLFRMRNYTTAICPHCRQIRGAETMKTCPACRRRGCARCWRDTGSGTMDWWLCQARLKAAAKNP